MGGACLTEKNNNIDDFDGLKTIELVGVANSLDIGLSSVIGKRKEQQDTVIADDEYMYYEKGRAIATLCDGMGGLKGGKQASHTCASLLNNAFHNINENDDVSAFYRRIVQKLDSSVKGLKNDDGSLMNAGTTLVSVAIDSGKLNWLSVGDSRIYIIRNNKIKCITHDHNYSMILNDRVKRGEITQEAVDKDPKKEALISYIGMGGVKYIDINTRPFPLFDGDCILLCSDGLYRALNAGEILTVLATVNGDMKRGAVALTDFAISKKLRGQDNTSVILIKFNDFS